MKQFILLLVLFAATVSATAQLDNTHWKGTIQGDETIIAVFHFSNDTLKVENVDDAYRLGVLTYATKDSVISFKKVYGQSDCDEAAGQYKYAISNNEIIFILVNDACEQRSSALDKSKWTKVQQ